MIKQFIPSISSRERPTPLVLLCGELLSTKVWESTADKLSKLGFGGAIVPFPRDHTIEGSLQNLHKNIQKSCFRPPVLITHSMGTYLGQKYLESFPLTGLIMVNPLPPNSKHTFQSLQHRWSISLKQKNSVDRLKHYYSYDKKLDAEILEEPIHDISTLIPDSLAADWLVNSEVELEPESVPMLIISTADDTKIISDTEYDHFLSYHNIDNECNVVLQSDETRLPMFSSSEQFHEHVLQWIDDVA